MTEYEVVGKRDNMVILTTKDAPLCCGERMIIEHGHFNSGIMGIAFLHFYCPQCKSRECIATEEYKDAIRIRDIPTEEVTK